MPRNALGSICFHAFLIFSVSCTNLYLRPAFIRTHAFIGSPNIRLVRALQDGPLQDYSESNSRPSYSSAKAVASSESGQLNPMGQVSANPQNINYYNQGLDGYAPVDAAEYASSQATAQANSQIAQANAENTNYYNQGFDGYGHVDPSEYASSQAIAQANSRNAQAYAQADAQANAQGDGQSYAHAESQANSGSYQLQYDNPISYYQEPSLPNYATAQAHSEVNAGGRSEASAEAEATVNSRSPDQEIPGEDEEPSSGTVDARSGAVSSIANAFAGAYSRIIPRHRYVRPHSLPGGRNIMQCSAEGEMHNFWSPVYDCMVCVCLRENYNLVPSCVKCDTCQMPQPDVVPIPEPDVVPIPQPPLPQPESRVSCDPLPTDSPFQNPMNPCQICLCQRSVNAFGQPDVQVTCEENPQCQPPQPEPEPIPQPQPQPDIIPIPDDNIVPVPEPQPICDGRTPNIPFLDPADACKICVCVVEVSYGLPDYRIICQPDPECKVEPFIVPRPVIPIPPPAPEPQPYPEPTPDVYPIPDVVPVPEPIPYPEPVPVPDVYPIPEPVPIPEPYPTPEPEPIPIPEVLPVPLPRPIPDIIPVPDVLPEPMPWPPAPVPPGPLPGPPPHESCHPYPPNRPFQHPWDQCQVCVCSEVISTTIINIEVNCYTSKSCCVEPPFPEPTPLPLPGPRPPYPAPPANLKYTDRICEYRSLEVDFVSPSEACKICKCRLYGDLVAPSCRRSQRPECAVVPVPTPTRDMVYIEPRCRYRMPHQNFQVDGNICVCEPIYRYVIAKCVKLRPNMDIIPWPSDQGNFISSAHSSAQANSQISPVIPSHYSSNIPSGSFGINIPLNGFLPNIGYNIQTNPEVNVNPMYYNGVINPQANSEPGNVIYPNYNGNNNQYSGSQADADSSRYNAESHAQAESSATSYNSKADASVISNSQANAHAESSSDSYYDVSNLYNLRKNKALANSVANANMNYGGQIYANNPYNGQSSPLYNAWNVEPIGGPGDSIYPYEVQSNTQANAISNAQSYAQVNSQSNVRASAISNVQAAGQTGSQANAQAIINSQANVQSNAQVYRPSNGQYGSVDGYYPYSPTDTQADSQATAQAFANILNYAQPNAQNNAQAYRPFNGQNGLVDGSYPYSQANTQADSQASAQALANIINNAQANAQNNAQAYRPYNGQYGLVDGSYTYSQANTQADSQASAQALANIINNAQANAHNNAQAYRSPNGERGVGNGYFIYSQPNSYPYSLTNTQADFQTSAQSLANSLNNAQVNAQVYSPPIVQYGSEDGYYPYPQTNTQADSQASAQAVANVNNAQGNTQSNAQAYGQYNAQANSQVFGQGLASALSNSQSNAISSGANAQASAQASAQTELGSNTYASQAQASSQASSGTLSYTPMYGTSNSAWRSPLGSSMYNDKSGASGDDLVQPGEMAQASASAQASSSIFDAGENYNLVIPGSDERPNMLIPSSKIVPIMRSGERRSSNEDPLISINPEQDEVIDQKIEAPQEASAFSPQQPDVISRR